MKRWLVNCTNCDFFTYKTSFRSADLVRDQHELEMFNWCDQDTACGNCVISQVEEITA